MNSNDKTAEKTELVIDALMYAEKHSLDINDKASVKKILESLDPEHAGEKEIEEFMELLQHADKFLTMRSAKRSKKTKILN